MELSGQWWNAQRLHLASFRRRSLQARTFLLHRSAVTLLHGSAVTLLHRSAVPGRDPRRASSQQVLWLRRDGAIALTDHSRQLVVGPVRFTAHSMRGDGMTAVSARRTSWSAK